jgi:4-phytase/acid phosphatase
LQYVVFVTRHGVRSPTGKSSQYAQYSKAPWPTWDVTPGYLTTHGFQLMQNFGNYDHLLLRSEGLLQSADCSNAAAVTFYADSDQRTRETGKALAAGLLPHCNVIVQGLPEGENDPLFHPSAKPQDAPLARAAIAGSIGDDPSALVEVYRAQLTALDTILATCGTSATPPHPRTSILTLPATLTAGTGDHAADLRGPLSTASTLTENILLEYTQGMPLSDVAWGCVDGQKLRDLIGLHTAASEIAQRTPAVAVLQASNLLHAIDASIEESVTQQYVANAMGKPKDQALFLVGHDTNLSNLSGLLNIHWLSDGRLDDTPPGSTLVFELWRSRSSNEFSVKLFFMDRTSPVRGQLFPTSCKPWRPLPRIRSLSNRSCRCKLRCAR